MNRRSIIFLTGVSAALVVALSSPAQAQTVSSFNGVIDVTLDIEIGTLTPVPSGDTVLCSVSITVSDALGGSFSDSAESPATLTSATAANCTLKLPYLWQLGFESEDKVIVSYTVTVVPSSATVTAATVNTRTASGFNVANFAVPSNNSTKSLTFTTKI